jgi:hypothetical protein
VRVCLAARENGLDISGTVFHLTGEPYTEAKAAVIKAAGARALDRYASVELGVIGIACSQPQRFDDQHFVSDKLALVLKERVLAGTQATVQALVLSTISPNTPKLMLNVESGDYATVSQRDCGCPFGQIGMLTHLCDIRAYDKLTSDGVTFQARDLFRLMEEVLPARFGGSPTDYVRGPALAFRRHGQGVAAGIYPQGGAAGPVRDGIGQDPAPARTARRQ